MTRYDWTMVGLGLAMGAFGLGYHVTGDWLYLVGGVVPALAALLLEERE